MKVAVYGYYDEKNFGDDLLAVTTARALRSAGAEPVIYGLDPVVARRHGFQSDPEIESLVRGAAFCVLGGGFFLRDVPSPSKSFLERREDMNTRLAEACKKNACPIHASSIGGEARPTPLGRGTERIFSSGMFRSAVVRLPGDIRTLGRFGKPVEYIPDLIWIARDVLEVDPPRVNSGTFRIGVNLWRNPVYESLAALIERLGRLRGVEVVFIRTLWGEDDRRDSPRESLAGGTSSIFCASDPVETLRLISTLDAVVSCRLHLGVSALSYGVPFLSIDGPQKTLAFLSSIGADFAKYQPGRRAAARLLFDLFGPGAIRRLKNWWAKVDVDRQRRLAWLNVDRLKSLVALYAARSF